MALEEYNNTSSNYYLWSFIHTFTIIDFEQNQRYNDMMKHFLINIKDCILNLDKKNAYITALTKLEELDMNISMVLFHWSIDTHNNINMMNNKSEWNYENALDRWANISCMKEKINDIITFKLIESTIIPTVDEMLPIVDNTIPVDNTTVAPTVDTTTIPVDNTIPVDSTISVDNTIPIVDSTVIPVDNTTIPVDSTTVAPTVDTTIPSDTITPSVTI
jgi:hypothetical protein